MSRKEVIGTDLDDVLGHFVPSLINYCNENLGFGLTYDRFNSFYFWEIWGGTREEAIEIVNGFQKTSGYRDMSCVEHSQAAIKQLSTLYPAHVISARQHAVADVTHDWLSRHFPSYFSGVHLCNHFSSDTLAVSRTKKEICDELGVTMFVEDNSKYAAECLDSNRQVFLMNRPWNQSYEVPQGMIRVNSWKEVLENI